MYDLEYAQGEGFDRHEEYAYIRKYEDEVLLFVLNFHDRELPTTVRIPREAFECLGQKEYSKAVAEDLLTDTILTSVSPKGRAVGYIPFNSEEPIQLTLPAWTGVILKISPKK